jgi:hypothetical protein
MDGLDPAAGAMPVRGEKSCAPSGARRRGRPKGSRNKATLALEAVLEDSAEVLMRTLIAKALAGDSAALRFCVGRVLPARRDRPVVFELPEIASAGDLVKASQAVIAACAGGILTPAEARQVMDLITAAQAIRRMADLEKRVIELEGRQQARAAKASRAEAVPRERRASPPARAASRRRRVFGVSRYEIEKGIPAPSRVVCKSPVFNSTTRFVGWAKSAAAAERFIPCAARFCPRGGPSIRVRTARAAPFAHPTRISGILARHRAVLEISLVLGDRGGAAVTTASTRPIRGPPAPLLWKRRAISLRGSTDGEGERVSFSMRPATWRSPRRGRSSSKPCRPRFSAARQKRARPWGPSPIQARA